MRTRLVIGMAGALFIAAPVLVMSWMPQAHTGLDPDAQGSPATAARREPDLEPAIEGAEPFNPVKEEGHCCPCDMASIREEARTHTVTLEARFLGVFGTYDKGKLSPHRCKRGQRVWGVVRFALVSTAPGTWRNSALTEDLKHMRMSVPCPELSRAAYQAMFPEPAATSDPEEDSDGRGSAPVLTRGETYRITFVENPINFLPHETYARIYRDVEVKVNEYSWTLRTID